MNVLLNNNEWQSMPRSMPRGLGVSTGAPLPYTKSHSSWQI